MNKVETYNRKNILSQIKWLVKMVRYLLGKETSEGGSIQSIQEGDNISIDNTDPQNPIVSSTGGGNFMTLNTENEVTEDWNINYDNDGINTTIAFNNIEGSEGIIISSIDNEDIFTIISKVGVGTYNIEGGAESASFFSYSGFNFSPNSSSWISLNTDSHEENVLLNLMFPNVNIQTSQYLPISVNGIFADQYGNIETSGGGEEQQFVQITEGSNTGWGLKYKVDNPNNYGNIGSNAIDFSVSDITSAFNGSLQPNSVTFGKNNINNSWGGTISGGTNNILKGGTSNSFTTEFATIGGGSNNIAGNASVVSGGTNNTAHPSGIYITVAGGENNYGRGSVSVVSGGQNNYSDGFFSTVSGGVGNTAFSQGEWVGGMYGTEYTPVNNGRNEWSGTDRIFNVGNGKNIDEVIERSDAFTILKNGLATLPSVTNTLIDAEPTGKAVVTKEWVEDAIDAIPTPSLTLEQARQNGNVLEGAVGLYNSDEGVIYEKIDYDPIRNSWGISKEVSWVFPDGFVSYHDGYINTFDSVNNTAFYITSDNPNFTGIRGNDEFDKQGERKAFAQIADVEDFYTTITGYDAGETQTLKHVNGVLQWVTD